MAENLDLIENLEEANYAGEQLSFVGKIAEEGELHTAKVLVNVRETPSKEGKILRTLKPGEEVSVFEFNGDWARIGVNEYVMFEFLV